MVNQIDLPRPWSLCSKICTSGFWDCSLDVDDHNDEEDGNDDNRQWELDLWTFLLSSDTASPFRWAWFLKWRGWWRMSQNARSRLLKPRGVAVKSTYYSANKRIGAHAGKGFFTQNIVSTRNLSRFVGFFWWRGWFQGRVRSWYKLADLIQKT